MAGGINKLARIAAKFTSGFKGRESPPAVTISDQTTGLPSLVSLFPELKRDMSRSRLGVIYIDIANFSEVEAVYGRETCSVVLAATARELVQMPVHFFGKRQKLGVCSLGGDDFLLFIDAPGDLMEYQAEYLELKRLIEARLNLVGASVGLTVPLSVHLGYAEIKGKPGYPIESLVYAALKEATYAAKNFAAIQHETKRQILRRILDDRGIQVVFQPVVSLRNGEILGFEALSRGPAGSGFESPLDLFDAAEQYQYLFELESLCHELAIRKASSQLGDSYLFLNVNPLVLNAANHKKGYTRAMLREYGVNVDQVVLEITERTAIKDYKAFQEALSYYRSQGFFVAIDDTGSGYSSLQAIAELRPEFVKIDRSLICGIDQNSVKKALLETLVDFSRKISSRIICEGIETEEELKILIGIDCDYGQGFLLGRPGDILPEINPQIRDQIRLADDIRRVTYHGLANQLGDITMCHQTVEPHTPVYVVFSLFKDNKFLDGVAVCEKGVPVGLIMRDRLFAMLGTQYGYDLFMKRQVTEVMDCHPLILPWYTPIEDAARLVVEQLNRGLVDYVIVTRDGKYEGVVSVAKMIDTMAKIQIQQAKDANPLTGLPGNRRIAERITRDLAAQKKFAVLYLDLDNFKAFNDCYGFEHGDRAITMLAQITTRVVEECGNKTDMVGHIGGDDFIIVTSVDKREAIASRVIQEFDRRVAELYDRSALERGYIIASDRQGNTSHIPIMSVSIAGVTSEDGRFSSHLQLTELAAEVKRLAKAKEGSCYVFNRRRAQ